MKINKSSSVAFGSIMILFANALTLEPSFREGNLKNIALGIRGGGSSHHNWVLSIADVLGQRGHNVSYLTMVSILKRDTIKGLGS